MNLKFTFLLLSIVLAIECLNATPLRKIREAAHEKPRKSAIVDFMINNMNKVAKLRLAECKRISEQVLNDPKLLENKSDVMEAYLSEFRQFVTHVNEFGDEDFIPRDEFVSSKAKPLMTEQTKLFDQFLEPTTKEAELVKASLIKNGVANQWKVLEPAVQAYAEGFIKEAENYLNDLSDVQKHEETKLQNTIDEIKNKTDSLERFQLLRNYFDGISFDEI